MVIKELKLGLTSSFYRQMMTQTTNARTQRQLFVSSGLCLSLHDYAVHTRLYFLLNSTITSSSGKSCTLIVGTQLGLRPRFMATCSSLACLLRLQKKKLYLQICMVIVFINPKMLVL